MNYVAFLIVAMPMALLSLITDNKGRRLFFLIGALCFIVLVPLSYKVGTDWYLYENYYYGNGLRAVNPDLFYGWVMRFFSNIGLDFNIFSIANRMIYASFILCLLYKYTDFSLLALIAVVSSSLIFLNDSLRQQFAAVFCIMAILMVNKGFLRFFVLVALASMFHASAISVLPIWFVHRSKFLIVSAFLVALVFFILSYFGFGLVGLVKVIWVSLFGLDNLISYKLLVYSDVQPSVFDFSHVARFLILCVYLFIYLKFGVGEKKTEGGKDLFLGVFFVGAFFMVFYEMVFFDAETIWRRLKEYFVFFFVVFPIYFAERYLSGVGRIAVLMLIAFYSVYVSVSFFRTELFMDNYWVFNNYLYDSIVGDSDDEAYGRAVEFWNSWRPAGQLRQ